MEKGQKRDTHTISQVCDGIDTNYSKIKRRITAVEGGFSASGTPGAPPAWTPGTPANVSN